mgnify:CR=1 FL=1
MDAEELLRSLGIRQTETRVYLLRTLEETPYQDAARLYRNAVRSGYRTSQASVYRTLDMLVQKGVLHAEPDKETRCIVYALHEENHTHRLVCSGCHKEIAVEDCPLADYEKKLSEKTGFLITGHSLRLEGECAECVRRRAMEKQ